MRFIEKKRNLRRNIFFIYVILFIALFFVRDTIIKAAQVQEEQQTEQLQQVQEEQQTEQLQQVQEEQQTEQLKEEQETGQLQEAQTEQTQQVGATEESYLMLDRACKNQGSITIPYLNKSSSLFVFAILRNEAWKQVYCVDLGKSAASYTAMVRDDSVLDSISPEKKQLLSYIPSFGFGSLEFPMGTIQNPRQMSDLRKTYGALTQGYIWAVLKGVISIDGEGSLVGVSSLKAILNKLNQYTYKQDEGKIFIDSFLKSLKARVKGTDEYSQLEQPPKLFFRTQKLASKSACDMQRKEDGSLEYIYVDQKGDLEKGELTIEHPLLSYRREGDNYIFTVSADDAEQFIKTCEESADKPGICLTKTMKTRELSALEGWRAANQNKSHQNLIYIEGKKVTKTAKSYIAFDVSSEELIPIFVHKKDGADQSSFIPGAEFVLQSYSDEQKKYETVMNFEEREPGIHCLNISKKILFDDSDNSELKFRVVESYVPEGYSGKSAFKQNVTGQELANGDVCFTAYNYRRQIKLLFRKVDEYLLDYKIAQFLSSKAELQFPYQDPSVYELVYQGEDEFGEPIYRSQYDDFVATVLGEKYTDENGIFNQSAYTNELGKTLLLSYLSRLNATFFVYEYSKELGTYKSSPLVEIETREGLSGEACTDFLMETEDNEGKLMICETKYPAGYESGIENVFYIEMNDGNDKKTVTLSNESTGEFITNAITLHRIVIQKNVRPIQMPSQNGPIVLEKISPKGVVFAVYAKENIGQIGQEQYLYRQNDLVCTVEIGEDGVGMTPYLYPGEYSIVETKAPNYCYQRKEERSVTIASEDVYMEFENIPIAQEIRIRKKDGQTDACVKGAVLGLYANQDFMLNGAVVVEKDTLLMTQTIVEDETIFSNLPFGKYYVKEIEAPSGYEKTDIKLEFDEPSALAEREKAILYGVFSNFVKQKRKLVVKKEIETNDIYFKHGNPTFLFRVKGKDYSGKEHTFEKAVVFAREDIKAGEKVQQKEVVFDDIISGTYEVEELPVARYRLKEIKDVVNGAIKDERAMFDLEQNEYGEVTFVNEKYEWQGFSHNDTKVNLFESTKEEEAQNYLKGLAVTCSDFMSTEKIDLSKVKVYAQYADGRVNEVDLSKCEIKPEKMNTIDAVFTNVLISYTEDGVTVKAEIPILYYEQEKSVSLYRTADLSNGTIAVLGYYGDETQIEIPAMIDGKIVSRLGRNYVSSKNISEDGEVSEATNQKNIQYYKFSGLERVKKITVPNTVRRIGYAAFYEYKNLEEVQLNQTRIINARAFCKTGLSGELVIPDDMITIGEAAFRETNISSLKLSSSLQSLGKKAFYNCKNLTGTVQIPILLGEISKDVFYNTNLTILP